MSSTTNKQNISLEAFLLRNFTETQQEGTKTSDSDSFTDLFSSSKVFSPTSKVEYLRELIEDSSDSECQNSSTTHSPLKNSVNSKKQASPSNSRADSTVYKFIQDWPEVISSKRKIISTCLAACSETTREAFFSRVEREWNTFCVHPSTAKASQTLVETAGSNLLKRIFDAFKRNFYSLLKDQNGFYSIVKMADRADSELRDQIFLVMMARYSVVGTKNGFLTLSKLVKRGVNLKLQKNYWKILETRPLSKNKNIKRFLKMIACNINN